MALDSSTVYRRLLGQALPHWRIFSLGIFAMIINGLTDTSFAWLMKPLMDEGFSEANPRLALMFAGAIIIIFFLRGLTSFLASYCISWVGRKVVTDMRELMFNHLVMMPAHYYDHSSSGELLSRLTYNTEQVAGAATRAVTVLVSDSFKVIFQLSLMFYLSVYLSLGFLIIAPIVAGLVLLISKRLRKISKNIQDSMGHVTHVAEEAISGHLVVKSFGGQEYEKQQYSRAVNRNRQQSMKLVATDVLNVPLIQFMVALVLSGAVYIVVSGMLPEVVTGGTFAAYVIALSVMLPSVKRLTAINAVLQRGIAAGQSIYSFLDELPEIDHGNRELARDDIKIEYRDVYFRYSSEKDDVLNGISFTIDAGSMTAFVGKSGGGKSTLVNLLPRFYDASSGHILVNDIPLEDIRLDSLRANISYVGQQVTLFNDTVRHNIAYGRLEDASDEEIIEAAKRAHAWEFIEKLPQGLDTLVGEDGILLSGGQRQRVAIARALLKNAPILILDEATSALDTESEKLIQAGLEALTRGRTTLVIAHRLSTIERADIIHVIDAGKLLESGSHEDLLGRNGIYAALYRMQFSDQTSDPSKSV